MSLWESGKGHESDVVRNGGPSRLRVGTPPSLILQLHPARRERVLTWGSTWHRIKLANEIRTRSRGIPPTSQSWTASLRINEFDPFARIKREHTTQNNV